MTKPDRYELAREALRNMSDQEIGLLIVDSFDSREDLIDLIFETCSDAVEDIADEAEDFWHICESDRIEEARWRAGRC